MTVSTTDSSRLSLDQNFIFGWAWYVYIYRPNVASCMEFYSTHYCSFRATIILIVFSVSLAVSKPSFISMRQVSPLWTVLILPFSFSTYIPQLPMWTERQFPDHLDLGSDKSSGYRSALDRATSNIVRCTIRMFLQCVCKPICIVNHVNLKNNFWVEG